MSNTTITGLPTAAGIDGSADYFPIDTASPNVTNKINRNTFLGVNGQPADVSTAQNITNKTLNNTNILTIRDDRFTLQDNVDATKQAAFQLSGITTATTRTYTLPNATTTLVGTDTTQTLTAKTITAPAITGGTIANSTITVDAIGEFTPANGVTIDGLNIKDGALNTNNSVVTANIADSAVTPAKLLTGTGSGWSWSNWTPSNANFTPGNGTLNYAKFIQVGKTIIARYSFTAGTTTSFGSSPTISLPVASVAYSAGIASFGQFTFADASGGSFYTGVMGYASTTTVGYYVQEVATYTRLAGVTAAIPTGVGTGDIFTFYLIYEAA